MRLDNIRTWEFLANGELNLALYKAVENGLDWSLLRFIMDNYEQWFVVKNKKQQLARDFIRFYLFENEKATRLLLDNLQGKTKDVRRFILNTRYMTETRVFLLRNLSDHRVRRFLLEVWEEKNVSGIVLGNLVRKSSEYEGFEYENFESSARNFILENLRHEAVRQSVIDHLHVEAVRDLLLDNLNHKVVQKFVSECLHEEALQKLLHGFFTEFWDGFDQLREHRKTAVRQFLLSNLSHEPVLQFVLDNTEIVPEPYWYAGMTREDGELLIELVVKEHSFCKLLLDINKEPVRALVLNGSRVEGYQSLPKKAVQQIVADNYGCTPVAEFIRKNFSWFEEYLLENLGDKRVLELMGRWIRNRDPLVEEFVRTHDLIDQLRRLFILDWYDRRYLEAR